MKRTKPTPTNNASLQNRRIVPEEDPGISADKLHQFVVMGIYADLTAYMAALKDLGCVAERCFPESYFHASWWSFEAMTNRRAHTAAVQAAAKADMIWCATCACEPLPETVESWIRGWRIRIRNRKTEAAFVAHLKYPVPCDFERLPARNSLYKAAQTAGMEFFERRMDCDCSHLPTEETTRASQKPRRESRVPDLPDDQQIRAWGINE